jgi:glucose-1-phosphatase
MKYTAFIFDIGNVLINFDLPKLIQDVVEDTGKSFEELKKDWSNQELVNVETGKVLSKVFYKNFSEKINLQWSYDEWISHWASIYTINKHGREIFLQLREKNDVYILSNLAPFNVDAITLKFPDFFNHSTKNLFSFELKYHKPDIRIYKETCRRINKIPKECIFFDDLPDNVKNAQSFGMTSIQFVESNFSKIGKILTDYI